jgi:uncharacterized membrane-anchored protein YjiN (DUF445 family)
MNKKRLYGPISLAAMATGSVATEVVLRAAGATNPAWQLLANGFHAGLVGALADWYAVHVLMHPAPVFMRFWPFKRHSDLLIRNRPKLEQNIIRMVQDELLSSDKVWGHLERMDAFGRLISGVRQPSTITSIVDFVRSNEILVPLANQLDRADIAASLDDLLKEQLGNTAIGKHLGQWLLKAVERGEQRAAWEAVLDGLAANVNSTESLDLISKMIRSAFLGYLPTLRQQARRPEVTTRLEQWARGWLDKLDLALLAGTAVRDAINKGAHDPLLEDLLAHLHGWVAEDGTIWTAVRQLLEDAIASYREDVGPVKRLFARFLEWAALDKEKAVRAIVGEIAAYIREVQQTPSHRLRESLREQIEVYAEKLVTGDKAVLEGFERLRKQIIAVKLEPVLEQLLRWAFDTLEADLSNAVSGAVLVDFDAVARSVAAGASTMLLEIRSNPEHFIRRRADGALRSYAVKLASEDPEATAFVERLKKDIVRNSSTKDVLHSLLSGLKGSLLAQLTDKESPLWRAIQDALREAQGRFLSDASSQGRLLAWLRPKAKALLEQHHSQIGAMVEGSLKMFTDAALVKIVDDKFGDDLQFVRLNGALLGFLIGVILSSVLLAVTRVMH